MFSNRTVLQCQNILKSQFCISELISIETNGSWNRLWILNMWMPNTTAEKYILFFFMAAAPYLECIPLYYMSAYSSSNLLHCAAASFMPWNLLYAVLMQNLLYGK